MFEEFLSLLTLDVGSPCKAYMPVEKRMYFLGGLTFLGSMNTIFWLGRNIKDLKRQKVQ